MGRLIIFGFIVRITGVVMGRLIVLVVSILEFIFVVVIYRDLSD